MTTSAISTHSKADRFTRRGSDDNLWNAAYERIYTFNTIINNVLSSTDATDAEKHRLRAEALYQRAFEYLALVNIYARHYHERNGSNRLWHSFDHKGSCRSNIHPCQFCRSIQTNRG